MAESSGGKTYKERIEAQRESLREYIAPLAGLGTMTLTVEAGALVLHDNIWACAGLSAFALGLTAFTTVGAVEAYGNYAKLKALRTEVVRLSDEHVAAQPAEPVQPAQSPEVVDYSPEPQAPPEVTDK